MAPYFKLFHASAGCGKTTKLMNIIREALDRGIQPEEIAFVTFTRAGAQVAKERVCQMTGLPIDRFPHFSTIHSMAFHAAGAHREEMMDGEKYNQLGKFLGMRLDDVSLTAGIDWNHIQDRQIVGMEQLYRNNPMFYNRITEDRFDNAKLVRYMLNYTRFKDEFKYRDYTDLLEQYVSDKCTEKGVRLACLDEMQDSTPLQWRVVLQAFKDAEEIVIAGDDKQALYTFTGASASTLINFKGEQHVLSETYRVPKSILTFVDKHIIQCMGEVYPTPNVSHVNGGKVEYIDSLAECHFCKDRSYYLLARGNNQLKWYIDWLREWGYNYATKQGYALTQRDYEQWQRNDISDWEDNKIQFARDCLEQKTWPGEPNIYVSTIHGVKGGEADVVVVMADIPPLITKEMRTDWGEDNEHRVFYVACTRAKERLCIVSPKTHHNYPYIL